MLLRGGQEPELFPDAMSHHRYDLIVRRARLDSGAILDIGITSGRVVASAAALPAEGTAEIDAAERLTLPGFVDPHLHLDKVFSRAELAQPPETLTEAIRASRQLKGEWSQDAIEERAARAVTMAIRAGTTAVRTHVDVDPIIGLQGFHALQRIRDRFQGQIQLQIVAFPQEGMDRDGRVKEMLRSALQEGADAIGGIPTLQPNPREHIDHIFELAKLYNADIDMHVDESDDPADLSIEYLAEKTLANGYQGRVVAGHCTSLAAVPVEVLHRVAAKVKAADISIVTLPSTNLHLQGRSDRPPVRRGLAPIRELMEAGINVTFGSDNIRDAFTPFGNARMLETGLLLAHAAHMGTASGLRTIIQMATRNAARALRLPLYGFDKGSRADLVIWDAESPEDALVGLSVPLWVVVNGNAVSGARFKD